VNQLFFGDNLNVLRESIASESVDLIYLDPPFNSKRDYNLLFKSPKSVAAVCDRRRDGKGDGDSAVADRRYSAAQITAFEDSWHWGEQAEREFDELVHAPNTAVSEMMQALRRFLGENDLMAYLNHVREREGAEIGLFISLEEPTRGMIADAASTGFYESASGKKYPRVQLLTIEGLLSGKQRAEHPDHAPDLNFKKARAEANAAQKDLI
jgi:hypothetical protein